MESRWSSRCKVAPCRLESSRILARWLHLNVGTRHSLRVFSLMVNITLVISIYVMFIIIYIKIVISCYVIIVITRYIMFVITSYVMFVISKYRCSSIALKHCL